MCLVSPLVLAGDVSSLLAPAASASLLSRLGHQLQQSHQQSSPQGATVGGHPGGASSSSSCSTASSHSGSLMPLLLSPSSSGALNGYYPTGSFSLNNLSLQSSLWNQRNAVRGSPGRGALSPGTPDTMHSDGPGSLTKSWSPYSLLPFLQGAAAAAAASGAASTPTGSVNGSGGGCVSSSSSALSAWSAAAAAAAAAYASLLPPGARDHGSPQHHLLQHQHTSSLFNEHLAGATASDLKFAGNLMHLKSSGRQCLISV